MFALFLLAVDPCPDCSDSSIKVIFWRAVAVQSFLWVLFLLDIFRAPMDIYWICGLFHWIFPAHYWISTGYAALFTGYFPRTAGYLLDMRSFLLDISRAPMDIYWICGLFHWILNEYPLDISRAGTGYFVRISTEYPGKLFPDHWMGLLQDTHLCTKRNLVRRLTPLRPDKQITCHKETYIDRSSPGKPKTATKKAIWSIRDPIKSLIFSLKFKLHYVTIFQLTRSDHMVATLPTPEMGWKIL